MIVKRAQINFLLRRELHQRAAREISDPQSDKRLELTNDRFIEIEIFPLRALSSRAD